MVIALKELAKKLAKIDPKLPKWTRKILYEHIVEVSEQLSSHLDPRSSSVPLL
ncbi:MAG: hypothetical protein P8Y23_15790 [Candidatus Lokiarchaeota archaeon]